MTTENDETVSAATAAARVLNPANRTPPGNEEPADEDDITARLAEQAALIDSLEQELHALTRRVRKLERMQPRPPT